MILDFFFKKKDVQGEIVMNVSLIIVYQVTKIFLTMNSLQLR